MITKLLNKSRNIFVLILFAGVIFTSITNANHQSEKYSNINLSPELKNPDYSDNIGISIDIFFGLITDLYLVVIREGEYGWFFRPWKMFLISIIMIGNVVQEYEVKYLTLGEELPFVIIDDYFHGLILKHFVCGLTLVKF
jgi:hypothetical protein